VQDALDWIHAQTGQRVTATRQLYGGLTSDVRAVTLANGDSLVLRRYLGGGRDAAPQVANEAATLQLIAKSGIPAPRFVAARPEGNDPMLLMTRVPGRVWLIPRDVDAWLADMARTLAAIHEVPIDETSPDPSSHASRDRAVPDWTRRHDLWTNVNAILTSPPDGYTTTFTHSDYQHFNMLWSRARLSGIVDWVYAGPGHPDCDAAHCRLNLVILFSIDIAERFRRMYEAEKGRPMDPWWDLRALAGYDQGWKHFIPIQVAGRTTVDTEGMDERVEGLIERILTRF
jgi:aminoglycoside phosphotransferase (APT) family kinase protein